MIRGRMWDFFAESTSPNLLSKEGKQGVVVLLLKKGSFPYKGRKRITIYGKNL